ncbi:polymer-forming cytoskeletal protein [Paenibacillus tundrae]|uniref:Cytoskeletal protein CcmA (Bactofilin family) n=1 Tax=Paenibacillus tundrae TaxID=528187 RepID=A0ABT9WGQ3_9BACL|nr:polymer-forming cytoskeletal protein [Paenibacillus tundrae]MDQ0172450.1 cytoskeletal protein CcmA (bactofilin family) [Paenibacillus tundrae]
MEERHMRNDLNVTGSRKTTGGHYNRVNIDGMAKLDGDLDCTSLNVNGTLKIYGALYTESVTVNGMAKVEGELQTTSLDVNGTMGVHGPARAETTTVNGMCTINGPLVSSRVRVDGMTTINGALATPELTVNGKCNVRGRVDSERIDIGGMATIDGDVQGESISVQGNLKVGGLLNADTVEIRLYTSSSAREVGGERIDIRRRERSGFWKALGLGGAPSFRAELIEGDEIMLEDTEADTVRGTRVHIGRGCNIRLVEYSGDLSVDPEARIGRIEQI